MAPISSFLRPPSRLIVSHNSIYTYAHRCIFYGMNSTQAKAQASILKALGHPIRVQMLEALSRGDRCVNDLRILAPVCQANISRHLACLKRVGLVTERRAGPRVIHHLACPGMLQALKCADEAAQAAKQRRNGDA